MTQVWILFLEAIARAQRLLQLEHGLADRRWQIHLILVWFVGWFAKRTASTHPRQSIYLLERCIFNWNGPTIDGHGLAAFSIYWRRRFHLLEVGKHWNIHIKVDLQDFNSRGQNTVAFHIHLLTRDNLRQSFSHFCYYKTGCWQEITSGAEECI